MIPKAVDRLDYSYIVPKNYSLPYIVFIHGAGGDKSQWEFQVDFLSEKGYGILTISLQNHGESLKDHEININSDTISQSLINNYTEDIVELIIQLGIKNYCLAGHSMGGAIVLNFVLLTEKGAFKDLLPLPKTMFLIASGAKLNVAPVFFDLIRNDFNEALKLMSKFSYGSKTELSVKLKNQKILTNNGSIVLYNDLDSCRYFDVRTDLESIKVPTVILCGVQDQMTPPKFSKFLHETIPNSQLFLIPDAGHFLFQEAPAQVNGIIHKSIQTGMDSNGR